MLKTIKNQHKLLLSLLFSTMIFLSRIWYIRECNVLAIRNDEYGYWNHAALFSGHDWSDVFAGHMHWYSYGYSLILTPLFWFSHNLHLMYKTAVILNGFFAVLTFFLCIQCAKILFPKTEHWLLLTASFMVCMYSSYITQGAIAWSETFLYLLVWLLFYLFLCFEQHPCAAYACYTSLCMGACYITHNRTIGIAAAYILIVLFLRLTDAIDWKLFAAMLLPLLLILFVNIDIKAYLCTVEGFGLKPKNGMGAQVSHLLSLLTLQGWQNLIRSLSGQMWALMASTFGLLFFGFVRCAARTVRAFRAKKPEKHTVFYLFALLSCLGTFSVSAISLIDPASITNLDSDTDLTYFIYTRYNECIIGILLLLGIFELAQCKSIRKLLLLTLGETCFYAAVSTVLYFNLQRITDTWHYRSFCAAGIGFYRLFSEEFSLKWCIVISAAGAFLLLLLLTVCRTRFYRLRLAAACILLAAAFFPTGLYSSQIGTIHSQLGKVSSGNLAMFDLLKDVVGGRDVYCTLDDTKNYRIAYELQVNLIDTHVYSITMEDLPENQPASLFAQEGYFICCSNGDLDKFEGDDYYLLTQSRYYAAIIKGDSLMQELAENQDLELINLNDLT